MTHHQHGRAGFIALLQAASAVEEVFEATRQRMQRARGQTWRDCALGRLQDMVTGEAPGLDQPLGS